MAPPWDTSGRIYAFTSMTLSSISYQGTTLYKVNYSTGYYEFQDWLLKSSTFYTTDEVVVRYTLRLATGL